MEKPEIRPLASCHPEPLNRSSPKVANVIMSGIPTDVQNLVTIPEGVSFPRMREIVLQKCLLGFFFSSSNAPQPRPPIRFSRTIRQTTWFRTSACSGLENKNLTYKSPYSRKNWFWAHFWRDLKDFRPKTVDKSLMGISKQKGPRQDPCCIVPLSTFQDKVVDSFWLADIYWTSKSQNTDVYKLNYIFE